MRKISDADILDSVNKLRKLSAIKKALGRREKFLLALLGVVAAPAALSGSQDTPASAEVDPQPVSDDPITGSSLEDIKAGLMNQQINYEDDQKESDRW